jgi:hypothetical protein
VKLVDFHHLDQDRPLGSPLLLYPPREPMKFLPLSEPVLIPLTPDVPLLDTDPARPLGGL